MVSEATISGALQQQANTAASTDALAEDFSQFLNLLTVQLQNQDPLSPMDTTEFTNQLVAFTGVEQQINTNQKLDSLVALNLGNSFSSSQNYVGQEISYVSSEFDYTGGSTTLRYSINEEASLSVINITNESGEVVYSTDGSQDVGAHEFQWNGETNSGLPAVPGTYEINVEALNTEGDPMTSSTVVSGVVRGVESQDGQIFLLVGDRAVPVGSVLNTNNPTTNSTGNDALTTALSYVGLDVSFLNNQINHKSGTPNNIIYDLDSEAEQAKLIVTNENGDTIYIGDVDGDAGQNITTWDGTRSDGTQAADGIYNFTIDALDSNDDSIGYSSQSSGIVSGVETANGQIFLNVGDLTINLNNIISAAVAA